MASGSTAHPVRNRSPGMGGDDDLAARDDAGRRIENQRRFRAPRECRWRPDWCRGNASFLRTAPCSAARWRSPRRCTRPRSPSRRSRRRDRNDCCAGRPTKPIPCDARDRAQLPSPARPRRDRDRCHRRPRPPRSPSACIRISGCALTTPALITRRVHRQANHPVRIDAAQLRLDQTRGHFARVSRGNVQPLEHAAAEIEEFLVRGSVAIPRLRIGHLCSISCSDRSAPATPSSSGPARSLAMISTPSCAGRPPPVDLFDPILLDDDEPVGVAEDQIARAGRWHRRTESSC